MSVVSLFARLGATEDLFDPQRDVAVMQDWVYVAQAYCNVSSVPMITPRRYVLPSA